MQRGGDSAGGIKIETERLGQLQNGDAVIVSRSDQVRDLVRQLNLRLQNVETRNRSRLEPVLLIFQLAFQQQDGLFLNADERPVQNHLIKLRLRRGDHLIEGVAKSKVGAVALKKRPANLAQ